MVAVDFMVMLITVSIPDMGTLAQCPAAVIGPSTTFRPTRRETAKGMSAMPATMAAGNTLRGLRAMAAVVTVAAEVTVAVTVTRPER